MARACQKYCRRRLEGFLTGLIVAMPREPVFGAAVGDDVEEAQELAVRAPAGGDDARQEGVFDCWWTLFGNRAAEKTTMRNTVYTKHQLTLQ